MSALVYQQDGRRPLHRLALRSLSDPERAAAAARSRRDRRRVRAPPARGAGGAARAQAAGQPRRARVRAPRSALRVRRGRAGRACASSWPSPRSPPAPATSIAGGGIGNCVACHAPPHFSDFGFHNSGVAQEDTTPSTARARSRRWRSRAWRNVRRRRRPSAALRDVPDGRRAVPGGAGGHEPGLDRQIFRRPAAAATRGSGSGRAGSWSAEAWAGARGDDDAAEAGAGALPGFEMGLRASAERVAHSSHGARVCVSSQFGRARASTRTTSRARARCARSTSPGELSWRLGSAAET